MNFIFLDLKDALSDRVRSEFPEIACLDLSQNKIISGVSEGVVFYNPERTALEVLQYFKRTWKRVVFIALTQSVFHDLQPLINCHMLDYLYTMPLDETELFNTLSHLLAEKELPLSDRKDPASRQKDSIEESMVTSFYIYWLIYGDHDKTSRMEDLRDKFDLTPSPNCALTIMVDCFWEICRELDNKSRYEIKMEYLALLKSFLKMTDVDALACSLIGTDKLIALIHVPEKAEQTPSRIVSDIAGALKHHISRHAQSTVSIGIGSVHEDSNLIWRSYEESFKALDYAFYLGSDSLIHFEEHKNFTTYEKGQDQLPDYKYNFFKHINQWSESEIITYYETTLEHLLGRSFSSETVKSIVIKYNIEILDHLEQLDFSFAELNDHVIRASTRILRSSTMDEIRQINHEYIHRIAGAIVSSRAADEVATAIDFSRAFIDKYYYTDFSLDIMAQVSNLSSAYFSRKFKERTGSNYTEYLEQTRLEKARELLEGGESSLHEIAAGIGFKDYSYFSSRFKKRFGHGPSYYRQQVRVKK